MQKGIESTLFCVGKEETTGILTGVQVEKDDTDLEFRATDSHRLSIKALKLEPKIEGLKDLEELNAVVPAYSLSALSKIIALNKGKDESVLIHVSSTPYALFSIGSYTLISRLLEGTYPQVKRLIPTTYKIKGVLDKRQLLKKLSIVESMSSDNHLIYFRITSNKITLESRNGTDLAQENIEVEGIATEIDLGFNSKYLLDGLKSIDSEKITININEYNSPVVFSGIEDTGLNSIFLIMPVIPT